MSSLYIKSASIASEWSVSKITVKKKQSNSQIVCMVCICKCWSACVCPLSHKRACVSFFFFKSGGDAYIRDGPRRSYTAGTDRCELSITPSPLDSSTKTKWEPQLHIILQKQRYYIQQCARSLSRTHIQIYSTQHTYCTQKHKLHSYPLIPLDTTL